jgi:hypothetical protein
VGRHHRDPVAVFDAAPGQREQKAPVADQQGARGTWIAAHGGTEAVRAVNHGGFGFDRAVPPDFLDCREIMPRPGAGEGRTGGADIAGKSAAFANQRVDADRGLDDGGDFRGRLQGAGIGRDEDPGDAGGGERVPGLARLAATFFGEFGIFDTRVAAGAREMQVEVTLAVSEQEHGTSV